MNMIILEILSFGFIIIIILVIKVLLQLMFQITIINLKDIEILLPFNQFHDTKLVQ